MGFSVKLDLTIKLVRSTPCIQLLNREWVDITKSVLFQVLETVLHGKLMIGIISLQ